MMHVPTGSKWGYQHTSLKNLFLVFKDGDGCPQPPHKPSAIWEPAASALRFQQQVQPTRLNLALEGCKNKPTWEQSSLLAKYWVETVFSKVSHYLFKSFVHVFSLLSLRMLNLNELLSNPLICIQLLFSPSQLHLDNKPDARGSAHATGLGWTKVIGRNCLNWSEIVSRPWRG